MNWKLISDNWEILSGIVVSVFAFFGGRKTKKNEEQSGELENLSKVREIEKSLLLDMEEQIKKLVEYNDRLEHICGKQRCLIDRYEKEFGKLEKTA